MTEIFPVCKLCKEDSSHVGTRGLCDICDMYSDDQIRKSAYLDDIRDKKLDLQSKQEGFLRTFGWHNSCQFPDSCWRWVKSIKGRMIAVSLSDAIHIEENIAHYITNLPKESKDATKKEES